MLVDAEVGAQVGEDVGVEEPLVEPDPRLARCERLVHRRQGEVVAGPGLVVVPREEPGHPVLRGAGELLGAALLVHPHHRPDPLDRVPHQEHRHRAHAAAGEALPDRGQPCGGEQGVRRRDVAGEPDPVARQQPGEVVEVGLGVGVEGRLAQRVGVGGRAALEGVDGLGRPGDDPPAHPGLRGEVEAVEDVVLLAEAGVALRRTRRGSRAATRCRPSGSPARGRTSSSLHHRNPEVP